MCIHEYTWKRNVLKGMIDLIIYDERNDEDASTEQF